MRVHKKANLDLEFERFRFRFKAAVPGIEERLNAIFTEWMRTREDNHVCTCFFKHLEIRPPRDFKIVDVYFGWFCERCLLPLESFVAKSLPEAVAISVGSDRSPYPPPDLRFIRVSDATAFLKTDGQCDHRHTISAAAL